MSTDSQPAKRRFPALLIITFAVVGSFALSFFLGQNGIFRLRQLQADYQKVLMDNHRLAMENKKTAEEIYKLRRDPATIEKIAREELQYVAPRDLVLIVPD